jgi:fermentation-respiration switch protein FrsA (DUF1100 family)
MPYITRLPFLAGLITMLLLMPASTFGDPPSKSLPIPGETLLIDSRIAFVILPSEQLRKQPQPWVWYAPTLNGLPGKAEEWMFERFTKAGIAIAGMDVGESYGSPKGRAHYSALHQALTSKRGFSTKPVLLARSRGGLMTLCWAAENTDKVGGFAGIYPVCNISSYPGVGKAAGAYQMPADEFASKLAEHNPIDRLDGLAKAKIPFFAIHGDVDTLVPLNANSGELQKRYEALGGPMELVIPKGQGHNMWTGFFECEELVRFVIQHAK